MQGDSPRFDRSCGRREFSLSAKRRGKSRMKEYPSLRHTRWDGKYPIVFIPKRRQKRIFGVLRQHLGKIFHELAGHRESKIVEGHLMSDHVHLCASVFRQSTRSRRWSAISRIRVGSPSRGSARVGQGTSPARTAGLAVSSCRPSVWTRTGFEPTSATRSKKTSATTR